MNVALPVMPLLHAGATGAEQDRWDLFGLALITFAFLLVTWVMLDVITAANARERPADARRPAPQLSVSATEQAGAPRAERALATHAATDEPFPEPEDLPARASRGFGAKSAAQETT